MYDPVYYQELRGDILLRLFFKAELMKEMFKVLDMQILYGEGWGAPELSGMSLNSGPVEPYIFEET